MHEHKSLEELFNCAECATFIDENTPTPDEIRATLEGIRASIHAENVSYSELYTLQSLAPYIAPGDLELLEWAGVPEHDESRED